MYTTISQIKVPICIYVSFKDAAVNCKFGLSAYYQLTSYMNLSGTVNLLDYREERILHLNLIINLSTLIYNCIVLKEMTTFYLDQHTFRLFRVAIEYIILY